MKVFFFLTTNDILNIIKDFSVLLLLVLFLFKAFIFNTCGIIVDIINLFKRILYWLGSFLKHSH